MQLKKEFDFVSVNVYSEYITEVFGDFASALLYVEENNLRYSSCIILNVYDKIEKQYQEFELDYFDLVGLSEET